MQSANVSTIEFVISFPGKSVVQEMSYESPEDGSVYAFPSESGQDKVESVVVGAAGLSLPTLDGAEGGSVLEGRAGFPSDVAAAALSVGAAGAVSVPITTGVLPPPFRMSLLTAAACEASLIADIEEATTAESDAAMASTAADPAGLPGGKATMATGTRGTKAATFPAVKLPPSTLRATMEYLR